MTTPAPINAVLEINFPSSNATNTMFQIEIKETSTIDRQPVTHYDTNLIDQQSS